MMMMMMMMMKPVIVMGVKDLCIIKWKRFFFFFAFLFFSEFWLVEMTFSAKHIRFKTCLTF